MSILIKGRPLYNLGASAFRAQIWTGYRTSNHSFSTELLNLFVKVAGSNHCPPGNSTIYRSYSNMSDTESKKAELKKRLTPLQYHVTQEKGTERAYTGKFYKANESGTYTCIVCSQPLFASDTKFDSGCGWPAFNDVLDQGKIKLTKDTTNVGGNLLLLIKNPGMVRTEVTCSNCGAHLGHVFNDGPLPTRKRFCINSASLEFCPAENTTSSDQ